MSEKSELGPNVAVPQRCTLTPSESHQPGALEDAVFGAITEGGPNYRNVSLPAKSYILTLTMHLHQVSLFGTIAIMTKVMIGLGVLSIPSSLHVLGLVPGVICLVAIAVVTTWSSYMVGTFKLNHPEVYGIDGAGYLMFGAIGRDVIGFMFCLCT